MANKDLFKQAIAEAKSVREAAIANAKIALEESLTPHLKDMLAAKLQELEGSEKEEDVIAEEGLVAEDTNSGFSEAAKDDSEESEDDAAGEEEAPEGEEAPEEGEGEADEDKEVSDLSVEDFKNLIRDIIAQEMGAAPAGEEEAIPGEEAPEAGLEAPAAGDVADGEEIDLEELLKELEGMAQNSNAPEASAEITKEQQIAELEAKLAELKGEKEEAPVMEEEEKEEEPKMEESSDLNEALDTIESMKKELSEVNLLNAKLLYLNKVLKANNLSESQQVNVIAAFDKAETVKEVKLVYETVCENLVSKKDTKNAIKESKGFASKATGTTASKPEVISEVSDAVRRMQKLAGII